MIDDAPHVLTEDFLRDPAATFHRLRSEGPLHQVVLPGGMRGWLVTDYDLARRALADPTLGKDAAQATALVDEQAAAHGGEGFAADLPAHMLNSDPPDHTRLRTLINRAFTTPAVARIRPRIEQITTDLLDAVEQRATTDAAVDLLDAFAYPLPITVICELIGGPQHDHARFRAWTDVVLSSLGPDSPEVVEAFGHLMAYLTGIVVDQRAHPDDSMLATLAAAAEDGDRLSEHELVSTLFLLLVAGFETTATLIGNGVLALLRNPDQLALLRADASRLPGAVEEFLRLDGPVSVATLRHTTTPWTAGEVTVPAGEFILVALLAANLDPARFPNLTLAREPETLRWRGSILAHGLVELPVRLR